MDAKNSKEKKRLDLLEAGRRFGLKRGLYSLSLDCLAKETGISKRTIYKHYGTRDAFLEALIQYDGIAWREWVLDAVREQSDAPLKRVYIFFETLVAWSRLPEFHGCLFAQVISSPAAFPDDVCHAAREQLDSVRQYIVTQLRKARVAVPDTRADALLMPTVVLLSGAGSHVCAEPGESLLLLAAKLLRRSSKPEIEQPNGCC